MSRTSGAVHIHKCLGFHSASACTGSRSTQPQKFTDKQSFISDSEHEMPVCVCVCVHIVIWENIEMMPLLCHAVSPVRVVQQGSSTLTKMSVLLILLHIT